MEKFQVVFYLTDEQIRVRFAPHLYQRFREMPSSHYHKATKENPHTEFSFPLTPHYAYRLHTRCFDLERQWRQPEFEALVQRGQKLAINRFHANNFDQPIQPKLSSRESWEHQSVAYTRLQGVDSLALFMGPGCGKTKVAIDRIANDPSVQRVLVVGPNRVLVEREWHKQFDKMWPEQAGEYEILSLVKEEHGSVPNRTKALEKFVSHKMSDKIQVVLVNYQSIWREPLAQALLDADFDMAIFDESHHIKSAGSKVSRFAAKLGLKIPVRLALTGTPMPNNPLDVYGQFRFLDSTVFGTNFNQFKSRYAIFGGYEYRQFQGMNPDAHDEFEKKLSDYSFRISREQALDLPKEQHEILTFHMPEEARKIYKEMEEDFFTYIGSTEVEASNVLARLTRLQQIAAGFLPIYDTVVNRRGEEIKKVVGWERVHNAKSEFLAELLEDLPTDKPIVVFYVYNEHAEDIRRATEKAKLRYGEVSGRRSDYQAYLRDQIDVLAIQIVSGSEGLNELVKSDIGIYYATGYYLGKYEQSIARLNRPGQESRPLFYHIHAEDTIEETIYDALMGKQSLVARFMPRGTGD